MYHEKIRQKLIYVCLYVTWLILLYSYFGLKFKMLNFYNNKLK
jgi:hypothetical protein